MTGQAQYVDGWAVAWSNVSMRLSQEVRIAAAQRYEMPRAEEKAREEPGMAIVPTPVACLTISIPDWPAPDAKTYVIPVNDAKRLIVALQRASREAEKAQTKVQRQMVSLVDSLLPKEVDARTLCAVEGCSRTRHFFDREGLGYCKQHAEELGIRPSGKVV